MPRFGERHRRGRLSAFAALTLLALLVFPSQAALKLTQGFDPRWVLGYLAAITLWTLWIYWHDKRNAERGGWRTPESTLHLAELAGGWPAAFVAQRAFGHKISKTSFQLGFWAIVVMHEAAAFDFLHDWHFLRTLVRTAWERLPVS